MKRYVKAANQLQWENYNTCKKAVQDFFKNHLQLDINKEAVDREIDHVVADLLWVEPEGYTIEDWYADITENHPDWMEIDGLVDTKPSNPTDWKDVGLKKLKEKYGVTNILEKTKPTIWNDDHGENMRRFAVLCKLNNGSIKCYAIYNDGYIKSVKSHREVEVNRFSTRPDAMIVKQNDYIDGLFAFDNDIFYERNDSNHTYYILLKDYNRLLNEINHPDMLKSYTIGPNELSEDVKKNNYINSKEFRFPLSDELQEICDFGNNVFLKSSKYNPEEENYTFKVDICGDDGYLTLLDSVVFTYADSEITQDVNKDVHLVFNDILDYLSSNYPELCYANSKISKQDREINRLKHRFDKILDENDIGEFIVITGKIGGDVETYRVYKDGSVYEE